jgi:hypothetical protein
VSSSPAPGSGRRHSLARGLAILVLPASIIPVLLCGPTLLRAPHRLLRQVEAAVQRMEADHSSAAHHPMPAAPAAAATRAGGAQLVRSTAARAGSTDAHHVQRAVAHHHHGRRAHAKRTRRGHGGPRRSAKR